MIGNNIPQEGLNLAPYNSLEEITLNQRALRKQNLEAVKTQQAKDAEEAVVTEFPPQAYGSDSGGYEFSPQEQRQMSKGSFTPITQEYEQSDYIALGQQVNTLAGMYARGQFEKKDYDTSEVDGLEFTTENQIKYLKDKEIPPHLQEEALRYGSHDWESFLRSIDYLDFYTKQEQQIADNFSTAGMLALGLPMGLFDVDMPFVALGIGAVSKIAKGVHTANLATRLSRALPYVQMTAAGAVAGAASMATYEAATGVYRDDSLINSALIGGAIGGGLGVFLAGASKVPAKVADTISGGKLSEIQAKTVAYERAVAEREALRTTIIELKERYKGVSEAEATLKSNIARDIETERGFLTKDFDEALTVVTKEQSAGNASIKNAEARLKALDEEIAVWKETHESTLAKSRAADEAYVSTRGLYGVLTKVQNELQDLTAKVARFEKSFPARRRVKAQNEELAAMKEKIQKLEQREKETQAKISANKELADSGNRHYTRDVGSLQSKLRRGETVDPKALLGSKSPFEQLEARRLLRQEELKKLQDARGRVDELNEEVARLSQGRDEKLAGFDPNAVIASDLTKEAAKVLADRKLAATPEAMTQLAKELGVIDSDLAKMQEGKWQLNGKYGLMKQRANKVDQLAKELEELHKQAQTNVMESSTFKALPEWAKKFMISPVERLLASDNANVRGLTTKLHSGTVHHGRANAMNAWNYKTKYDNELTWVFADITADWKAAKADGSFTGTRDEWFDMVGNQTVYVNGQIQRKLFEGNPAGARDADAWELTLAEARERAMMGGADRVYVTNNKHLINSVNKHLDYYERMWDLGNSLGMKAFPDSLKWGYTKRMYSAEKINQLGRDRAIDILTDAQWKRAVAEGTPMGDDFVGLARARATAAIDSALDQGYKFSAATEGAPQKQRTIQVFDDDIIELLDTNVEGVAMLYGRNLHGAFALKQTMGVDNKADALKMIDEAVAETADSKTRRAERERLEAVVDTILGMREIDKNPWSPVSRITKGVSSYSSVLHTMAFALPTVTEIASVAKEFGAVKTFDRLFGTVGDMKELYKNGTISDRNSAKMFISYSDAYASHKVNRYDMETSMDSVDRLQQWMDTAVQKQAFYGGMMPLTDGMRMMTASLAVDFLANLSVAGKISKADLKRLGDMGFTEKDLPIIKKALNVSKTGEIRNFDRTSWGNITLDGKTTSLDEYITLSVQQTVERTILHPNGITLPLFMTNMAAGGIIPRILMKFMRFPFESYERMLARGMQEADIKQAMGVATNVGLWGLILSLKDAVKDEDKQQYGGDDGVQNLVRDAFLYNSWTGGVLSMAETGYGMATGKQLTSDYRYNLGGVALKNITDLTKGEPKYRLPFYTFNIGDGVSDALVTLGMLEETNK